VIHWNFSTLFYFDDSILLNKSRKAEIFTVSANLILEKIGKRSKMVLGIIGKSNFVCNSDIIRVGADNSSNPLTLYTHNRSKNLLSIIRNPGS